MSRKYIIIWMGALSIMLGATQAVQADAIRRTDGQVVTGLRIKWFPSRQEYQVEGTDGTLISIPGDEVDALEIAKPAEMDKAMQAFNAQKYAEAIPILEDIIARYKRLKWDGVASEMLAKACLATGDFKKAVQIMSGVMEGAGKNLATDEQFGVYWTALAGANMKAGLKQSLSDAIQGSSRPLAALALVKRGDMNKEDGKRDDAALDYLRSILMYEDVAGSQPEALYKAAVLFDEMRDPRAEDLKKRLRARYSDSPYARKLGG